MNKIKFGKNSFLPMGKSHMMALCGTSLYWSCPAVQLSAYLIIDKMAAYTVYPTVPYMSAGSSISYIQ